MSNTSGSLADLDDLDTEYSRATERLVQNVHAGISRRDWHATEQAANAFRDSGPVRDVAKLVDFFRTTLALEEGEREYYERSNDVDARWETADREEFTDLDNASRALDETRYRLMDLKRDLAHLNPTDPRALSPPAGE